MAVSAADFYTYAKSTGTEIPDSKQKEAELVPVINRWKKGRLREDNKPEQDNTGRNIGAAVLGTGAAALAYGIGRRFGRGKGNNPVSKPPQAAPSSLPNVDNITGLADTTFIPSPITPQDSRGIRVGKQGNLYRTQPVDIKEQPQVKTEFQNQAAADRDWDLAYMRGREQGLSDTDAVLQAKRTVGQPVPDWYVPGPETEHRNKLSKLQTRTSVYSPAQIQEEVVSSLLEPKKSFTDKYLEGIRDNVTTADRVLNDPEFTSLVKAQRQQEGRELGGEANKQRNIVRRVEKEVDKTLADVRKGEISPRSYIESTGSVEPTTDVFAPDTLVAEQNLNDPALSIQSSEAVDTGLDQVRQRIDTEVQRDTDSISLGKELVKTEVLQEDLLEQAAVNRAEALDLLTERRLQLDQAGVDAGTRIKDRTSYDNALVKGWSARSDVEPNITDTRFRENVVLPKEIEEVVSTKIPESDASNVAKNYYDPNTGNIQFATEEGGSPLIRDIYKERVIPTEDVGQAASGTSIRGTSRSMDISEPNVRTRTDEFTGDERPDRIGGTLPIGGVPHIVKDRAGMTQKSIQTPTGVKLTGNVFGPLPAGPINAPQLSKQEVVHSITQSTPTWLTGNSGLVGREDLTGGGAGMGIYGRQSGYVPGPNSKTVTGLRSTGLRAKPTDLPEGQWGDFNPTTSRDDYRGYSNAALKKQISTGTYKSGKVSPGVKDAQKELTLRTNLNYPVDYTPSKETTINSMQVSDDIRKIYSSGRPDAQQQVEAYKSALRKKMGI